MPILGEGVYRPTVADRDEEEEEPGTTARDRDGIPLHALGNADDGGEDTAELVAPTNSTFTTSTTIVSNMIGVGVLGLPAAVRGLGWALFTALLIAMAGISLYSALILGWLKGHTSSRRGYPDLAADACKGQDPAVARFYRRTVQVILFVYLQGVCTLYVITMKLALETVFERCISDEQVTQLTPHGGICTRPACTEHGIVDLPDSVWLFAAVALLFPCVQYRSLARGAWLTYMGVVTILVVDVVILIRSMEELGRKHHNPDLSHHWEIRSTVNAITAMAFAFGGHAVMPDILAEMRTPATFSKAVYQSQAFMVVNYALVGFLGYAAFGNEVQTPVTLSLPRDAISIFTNICLLLHVVVAYTINSTVFVKNLCHTLWPGEAMAWKSRDAALQNKQRLRWAALSSAILLLSFMIAVVVPYFGDLMDVFSAVGIFSLSIWMPATLFLLSQHERMDRPFLLFNGALILLGLAGTGLGIWAAFDDLVDKLAHCHIHFGY